MKNSQIVISKPESVLKTYLKSGEESSMEYRYSSAIIVVLRGKLDFIFSDKVIQCDENHSIFIPKGAKYKVVCHEYAENLLFNFQTETQIQSANAFNSIDKKIAEDYFNKIDILFMNRTNSYNMILSLYYGFFSEMFDLRNSSGGPEKYVYMAEKIIAKNYSSNTFTCMDAANEINISEVYLRKLFVKYRGMPPSRFLLETRMKKARLYIIEGYTVSECAQYVGYSDIYQFSRAYKKYYGYTPSMTIQNTANHIKKNNNF